MAGRVEGAGHDLGPGRGWMWLVVLLVVLGVVETLLALLVTHRVLPATGALVADATVVNWTVVAVYVFASPLWGRVELREDGLMVRFGLVGSLRAPLEAILEAAPYQAPSMAPLELGAGFDEETRRMSLAGRRPQRA